MNKTLLAALTLAVAPLAQANDAPIQFNNLTLSYLYSEADNVDGDGFGISLQYAFTNNIYATADYNTRSLEGNSGSALDFDFISVGAGYAYPLTENGKYVAFGAVTYEMLDISTDVGSTGGEEPEEPTDSEGPTGTDLDILLCILFDCSSAQTKAVTFDANGANGDTAGYGAQIGLRAEVYPNVEVVGSYLYRMYDDPYTATGEDTESVIGLGAAYRLGQWAIGLSYTSFAELELDEYTLGVRYDFGRE